MAKQVPFEMVLEKAYQYKDEMTRFLRDMIAIPSESCDEKLVVQCIKKRWKKWVLIRLRLTQWVTFSAISATARI